MATPRVISPRRYSKDNYRNEFPGEQNPIAEEKTIAPVMKARSYWKNLPSKHFGYIFFICLIGMIYIYNAHLAEKQIRKRDRLLKQVKELKTLYHIADANLSMLRKQTHISLDVDTLGLKKLERPPFILIKPVK